jgi:hypothetical protein
MSDPIHLSVIKLNRASVQACDRSFKKISKGNMFSGKIPISLNITTNSFGLAKFGYLHFQKIKTFPIQTNSFILKLYKCHSPRCMRTKTNTKGIFTQIPYGSPLPLFHLPLIKGTKIVSIAYGDANGDGANDILIKLANGAGLLFLQQYNEDLLLPNFGFCGDQGNSNDLLDPFNKILSKSSSDLLDPFNY